MSLDSHTSEPAETQTAVHRAPLALSSPSAHARLWLCASLGLALDLWSKHEAFAKLDCQGFKTAIPNLLVLQKSINPGALFGMGSGLVWLFILASFVALAFVFFLFATSGAGRRSLHIDLGLILAGSLGNLYDRAFITADRITLKQNPTLRGQTLYGSIVREGSDSIVLSHCLDGAPPMQRVARADIERIDQSGVVRDFLKFTPKFGQIEIWPWVFNAADSMLVVGVAMLLLNFWFERKHASPTASQAAAGANTGADPRTATGSTTSSGSHGASEAQTSPALRTSSEPQISSETQAP